MTLYTVTSLNCNWIDSPIHKPQVLLVISNRRSTEKTKRALRPCDLGLRGHTASMQLPFGMLGGTHFFFWFDANCEVFPARIWTSSTVFLMNVVVQHRSCWQHQAFWGQAYLAPEVKNNSSYSEKCVAQQHLELHQLYTVVPPDNL